MFKNYSKYIQHNYIDEVVRELVDAVTMPAELNTFWPSLHLLMLVVPQVDFSQLNVEGQYGLSRVCHSSQWKNLRKFKIKEVIGDVICPMFFIKCLFQSPENNKFYHNNLLFGFIFMHLYYIYLSTSILVEMNRISICLKFPISTVSTFQLCYQKAV